MDRRKTELIATLGPATSTEQDLRKLKDKGVDYVRVNMSHSSIEDLKRFISLAKRVGLTFIVDTEGSQIRTGRFDDGSISLPQGQMVEIHAAAITGNSAAFSLKPGEVISQLHEGDLIYVDFDSSVLQVVDASSKAVGYVMARAVTNGTIASNKAVVLDLATADSFTLPALTSIDREAIGIGLSEGIRHIALSYVRSGEAVDEVRRMTRGQMRVISKIECQDALENLEEIIDKSDALLLDRGDLSREIPMEKVPFVQRVVVQEGAWHGKPVYVATNLLETMITKEVPTRAEVQDVITTVVGGAAGLTLAAETAIGRNPMECVNVLNRIVAHAEEVMERSPLGTAPDPIASDLASSGYLWEEATSLLIPPHGGVLVDRMRPMPSEGDDIHSIAPLRITSDQRLDAERIALGAFSPLTGFMGWDDYRSVVSHNRLESGVAWPLPITLEVDPSQASRFAIGNVVPLSDDAGNLIGQLSLEEKYEPERSLRRKVCFGGPLEMFQLRKPRSRAFELTPRQLRRLFDERGWETVLGIQSPVGPESTNGLLRSMVDHEMDRCDGVLFHKVTSASVDSQDPFPPDTLELEALYPRNRIVAASYSTYRREPQNRSWLLDIICAKNYGCSHLIISNPDIALANMTIHPETDEGVPFVSDVGVEVRVLRLRRLSP